MPERGSPRKAAGGFPLGAQIKFFNICVQRREFYIIDSQFALTLNAATRECETDSAAQTDTAGYSVQPVRIV